jgi:creatinine amidohydrolase
MQFGDLSWMDVESYLQQDDRVVVVVGSTEQHAYLSLATDVRIPHAIVSAATAREQVLVTPPLNFGVSPHFAEFPGTISLTEQTFHQVLYEIVFSLVQHGFRGILIANGHAGNTIPPQLQAVAADLEDLNIIWYEWYNSVILEQFATEENLQADHANWSEAFSFTRVGTLPGGEKAPASFANAAAGLSYRDILGDGSFGGPYQIEEAKMNRLFEQLVEELAGILKAM